jgi:hypothetical protein
MKEETGSAVKPRIGTRSTGIIFLLRVYLEMKLSVRLLCSFVLKKWLKNLFLESGFKT